MKKVLAFVLGVILLGSILYFLDDTSRNTEADPELEYRTVDVLRGELTVKISATGLVEPNFQVEVKSKASGEVWHFPFEEGDQIGKGKPLLELDKSDELRNVARAETDLESALARLKKTKTALLVQKTQYNHDLQTANSEVEAAGANLQGAQDKLKRQVDLFTKRITSQQALDEAQTTFKVSKEELVQAQANSKAALDAKHDVTLKEDEIRLAKVEVVRSQIAVDEARERLQETEIFAPINGVIIKKMIEEGQIISSGINNVSGGTALCIIADMSRLFIIADVDETDIGSIHPDQEVTITTDAFPGETFNGKVKRIAPQGEVENNITIFKVKVEIIGNGKISLKPMMTANVDIISHREKNTLYVPREAVNMEGVKPFALALLKKQPQKIPVKTGVQTPIHVQVLSGVKKGQKLIVGDWEKILSGKNKFKDNKSTLRRILWMLRSK